MIESVFFYLYNKLNNNKFSLILFFLLSKSLFLQSQTSDKIILDSLQKLEARITPKGLKDQHPFQGFITLRPVSDKDSVALELAEYQYENGARVFLMNTPYEKNVIHLKAISWGGYSLYDDEEDRKLVYSSPFVAQELGVADLNREELEYLLNGIKGENNKIDFKINELNEEMNIQFGGEQFEPILKVIYNYFTNFTTQNKKSFDDTSPNLKFVYELMMSKINAKSDLKMLLTDEYLIKENHNFPNFYNPEKFARAQQLFKERFADGGDFTFVFVGDFSKVQNIVGVFNKYIGNLPKDDKGEFCKFLPTSLKKFPDQKCEKCEKCENFCMTHYEDSTQYSAENYLDAFFMQKLFSYKIKIKQDRENYNEKNCEIYNRIVHYPFSKLTFDIYYLPQYEKITENAITELQSKPLTNSELEKINQYVLSEYKKEYENPDTYLRYLTQNIMEGLELDKFFKRKEFEAYLKTFTPEKIQQLAKQYWNVERRTRILQN